MPPAAITGIGEGPALAIGGLMHPSAWNTCSPKCPCRLLHRPLYRDEVEPLDSVRAPLAGHNNGQPA